MHMPADDLYTCCEVGLSVEYATVQTVFSCCAIPKIHVSLVQVSVVNQGESVSLEGNGAEYTINVYTGSLVTP